MYKAVHGQEGREIVILDSHWAKGIEYLRALDQQDLLVCQGCKQPVRVRAGDIRRWHFAHKQLTTTEREFMRQTVYDALVSQGVPGGQSLHYLDAETRTLTTFRGLHLVHAPHVFQEQAHFAN